MKQVISVLPLVIVLVLTAHVCYAPPLPPVPSDGAPLDAFALALLVSGAAYGAYRTRNKENDNG